MNSKLTVHLSSPVQKTLNMIAQRDSAAAKRILAQLLNRLPIDPYPDIQTAEEIFHSCLVKNLEIDGYYVSRLKSLLFLQYRIFYLVDDDFGLIYVLEIVPRNKGTYDKNSKHYQTIKAQYLEYFQTRGTKR